MYAASASNEYIRYYFVTIDPDINSKETELIDMREIASTIDNTLRHPSGWAKFGYSFQQLNPAYGLYLRINKDYWKYVIHVRLSREDTIKKNCGFGQLSCADLAKNVIYFNVDRWLNGSQESGLPLDAYRVYVILHEFGHLLNRKHKGCTRDPMDLCPVMYQQTISKGCCVPNPFPLDWE